MLLEELIRRQEVADISSQFQVLEAERVRLTLLEEKIREVLAMLKSLNTMVRERLGDFDIKTSEQYFSCFRIFPPIASGNLY